MPICQNIIEENWLEFLAFTKKRAEREEEFSRMRMEALKDLEDDRSMSGNLAAQKSPAYDGYGYYDISLNSFWCWYISNKV
jgi:hypothetical protein